MASLSAYERIAMTEARMLALESMVRKQEAMIEKLQAQIACVVMPVSSGAPKALPKDPPPKLARMIDIASEVAAKNMISLAEIRGPSRVRAVAWPRQDAMRAMIDAGYSTTQIGRFFGGRDHTTVMHGARASRARASE